MDMTPVCDIHGLDDSVVFERCEDYLVIESILLLTAQTMQSAFGVEQNYFLFHCLSFKVYL